MANDELLMQQKQEQLNKEIRVGSTHKASELRRKGYQKTRKGYQLLDNSSYFIVNRCSRLCRRENFFAYSS